MRRTQRLRAHDDQGEAQGDRACERKDPPGNLRPDGIAFEVIRHGPPRQRRRDKEGDDHHQREILRDKIHEARYGSTEYLPDANLFDALLGGEGGEPEQPKACNDNGQNRKQAGQHAGEVDGGEFFLELNIHKRILEGILRPVFPEYLFHFLQRRLKILPFTEPDGE